MPRRKPAKIKSPIAKLRAECRATIPHFRIRRDTAVRTPPPQPRRSYKFKRPTLKPPQRHALSGSPASTLCSPLDSVTTPPSTRRPAVMSSPDHNIELTPLTLGGNRNTAVIPGKDLASMASPRAAETHSVDEPCALDSENAQVSRPRPRKLTKLECLLADWEHYEKGKEYNPTFFDRRRAPGIGEDDDGEDIYVEDRRPHPFNAPPSRAAARLPPMQPINRADYDNPGYTDNDGFVEIPDNVKSLSDIHRQKIDHLKRRRSRH